MAVIKYLAKHNVTAVEHPPYFPDLSPPDVFLFLRPESNLKVQRFATAEEVTAQATRALTEVSKNGFQECFQKLYERWKKCVTPQGNYTDENIIIINVRLRISV
jgi:hypothetical protein